MKRKAINFRGYKSATLIGSIFHPNFSENDGDNGLAEPFLSSNLTLNRSFSRSWIQSSLHNNRFQSKRSIRYYSTKQGLFFKKQSKMMIFFKKKTDFSFFLFEILVFFSI